MEIYLLNYFSKENKSFDEKSISDILNQLNNSFKIMTKNKIVHRALNLKNILIKFINKDLIYKLKLTNDSCLLEHCFKKSKFNLKRNIDYYAPEILNKQNYNEKCDLWSLCVIIYVLIFKKLPSKNGDILNQFNLIFCYILKGKLENQNIQQYIKLKIKEIMKIELLK